MKSAQSNEDFAGEPDYYVFDLLAAMLPTYEDATDFFREKLYKDVASAFTPKQEISQEPESMDKTTSEKIRDLQNKTIALQEENEGLRAASPKN